MDSLLRHALIQTLAFFDLFDYPLTSAEWHRWLWKYPGLSYEVFTHLLDQKTGSLPWTQHRGYYCFSSNIQAAEKRQRSVRFLEKKMKKAKKAGQKIRCIPFVRALFVCNLLPITVKQRSDIDVLIVVKENRLWTTRLLITLVLSLFRLRRNKKKITDGICLSFYITDNALDLSSLRFQDEDIYFIYWLAMLLPVYDPENFYTQIQKKNDWTTSYISNAFTPYRGLNRWTVTDTVLSKIARQFGEWFLRSYWGDWIEKVCKKLQRRKMEHNKESVQRAGDTRVVIGDTMLKFHENDRRELFWGEWRRKVGGIVL